MEASISSESLRPGEEVSRYNCRCGNSLAYDVRSDEVAHCGFPSKAQALNWARDRKVAQLEEAMARIEDLHAECDELEKTINELDKQLGQQVPVHVRL